MGSSLRRAILGELLGTYLLVLFGTGAVAASVLTGALSGLGQVAAVWAIGVTLAIVCSAPLSGAHLNPAVSLAFALVRPTSFRWRQWPAYALAQLVGATLAGGTIAAIFGPLITRFEAAHDIIRGAPGSQLSAMVFGQYFPNPALFGTAGAQALVSPLQATLVEGFGTAILVFVIFALTSPRGPHGDAAWLTPSLIGLCIAALIMVFAPLTQAGLNPARDLGPRLVAWLLGWGAIAIPGPENGFLAYIIGPLAGGPLGGAIRRATGLDGPVSTSKTEIELEKLRVLFICTHNSARSQMAEGWLRHLGGDRFDAYSAGTESTAVRPQAIQVMAEVGVDIAGQQSKTLERYLDQPWDVVITVCDQARESCPFFPNGKNQLHWSFPDPSQATGSEDEVLRVYREVRDAIKQRIAAGLLTGG